MTDIELLIRESNLIEGIDSEQADADSLLAWNRMESYDSMTHYSLQLMHRMITHSQPDLSPSEKGQYRRVQVYVGDHIPPAPMLVMGLMDNFLSDFMEMDPIDAHIRFETIHPFIDGNGRTGRMLMWWHQWKTGKTPTLFWNDEKHDVYYRLFTGDRSISNATKD